MVLRFIDTDEDEVKKGAILEREKKLRGLLFLGGRFNYTPAEMALIRVPFVCCSYTNSFGSLKESEYSSVSIDDYKTAFDAVSVLLEAGHRRIAAFFDDCADASISELRYEGYLDALKKRGIPADPALVVQTGSFEMDDFYRGMLNLIESGADVNLKDNDDNYPLNSACDTGDLSLVKLMLEKGADVTVTDEDNWTPLHYAVYSYSEENIDIVKLLVENGFDEKVRGETLSLEQYGKLADAFLPHKTE